MTALSGTLSDWADFIVHVLTESQICRVLKSFAVVRRKHTQLRSQLPLLILSSKLCFLIILLHKALQNISRIKIECYYNLCLRMLTAVLLMKIKSFVCSLQSYN